MGVGETTALSPLDSPLVSSDDVPADLRPAYPPPRHAMSLLALESEQDLSGDVRGWMPVTPYTAAADGMPRLATVAMLVDALGGLRSITASDPEWAFTADMSIHLLPVGPIEVLQADLHVRRRGRRTLVIEAELLADGERPAGSALLTFAVVPRPEHLVNITIDMTPGRRMMNRNSEHEHLEIDYLDELQLLVTAPGSARIELHPTVCNTVGALHGAVHASLVDEASASLARALLGRDVVTTDMHLAYLELGRVGPLSATALSVGGPSSDHVSAVVEIRDGNGMLVSYATTEVCGL
ncbi:unannotated protein [freshwater metagenome]|uniref:Unannotated protein n=1 Tax=freshwater metagenome TaxID=449393 RepID=A0A6J6X2I8_9ZZZZ